MLAGPRRPGTQAVRGGENGPNKTTFLRARQCRARRDEHRARPTPQHVAQLLARSPVVGHPTFVELEVDEAVDREAAAPTCGDRGAVPPRSSGCRTVASPPHEDRADGGRGTAWARLPSPRWKRPGRRLRLARAKRGEVVGGSVTDHVAVVDLRSDASPISRGSCAGLSRRSIGRFRPSSGERHENHSTTPAGVSEKRNWLTIRAIARHPPEIVPFRRRGFGGGEPALELARAHTDQLCNPACGASVVATSQATTSLPVRSSETGCSSAIDENA